MMPSSQSTAPLQECEIRDDNAEESDSDCNESDCERFYVSLKEGLALSELKNGVEFELDPEKDTQNLGFPSDEHYFDKKSVFENLHNSATLGENDDMSGDPEDESANLEPFESIRKKMQPLMADNAIMKRVKKEGYGGLPPKLAQVTIHYNAYLEYGDEPFDSTRLRNRPQKFILQRGDVIPGLDIAVASMRKSEVAEILVEPKYAYGPMGMPPRIPANASVLYVVELINFVDCGAVIEFEEMGADDRKTASFKKVMEVCKSHNFVGNEHFKNKEFSRAAYRYNQAIRLLSDLNMADETEETNRNKLLVKLYLNTSQCHLNMGAPNKAVQCAIVALRYDPENSKGLFRCGKSNRLNGNFAMARMNLEKLAKKEPNNRDVIEELRNLDQDIKRHKLSEQNFCSKLFPGLAQKTNIKKPELNFSVTEEFKANVKENLLKFKNREEAEMLPFSVGFSDDEIEAIKVIATEVELFCVVPEHGDAKIKIYKTLPN